jgi:hypothetical protein
LKLLARTQIVIGIVSIVPIDIHLVVIPVHVRNIAIVIARTRYLPASIRLTDNLLQNYLRLTGLTGFFYEVSRLGGDLLQNQASSFITMWQTDVSAN